MTEITCIDPRKFAALFERAASEGKPTWCKYCSANVSPNSARIIGPGYMVCDKDECLYQHVQGG